MSDTDRRNYDGLLDAITRLRSELLASQQLIRNEIIDRMEMSHTENRQWHLSHDSDHRVKESEHKIDHQRVNDNQDAIKTDVIRIKTIGAVIMAIWAAVSGLISRIWGHS